MKIATKILAVLLITSIIPIGIIILFRYFTDRQIYAIVQEANMNVAEIAAADSMKAISEQEAKFLKLQTGHITKEVERALERVQADSGGLADFAAFLYNNEDSVSRYPHPSAYAKGPNNTFGSLVPDDNSWLMVSNLGTGPDGNPPPEVMEEVHLTEFLDTRFRSIARYNPYAVQVYLNTKSQITRGVPFVDGRFSWLNATSQFPADMDLTKFDFYYLADETHDPARASVWTELYWDPAGLGWMVSCVTPVYLEDKLKGVAGIDITLSKMTGEIINTQIRDTGFVFLMSHSSQAIAFSERALGFFGFAKRPEDTADDAVLQFYLNSTKDDSFRRVIKRMQQGESGIELYEDSLAGREYYFAFAPINLTGWSIGVIVPVDEVISSAIETGEKVSKEIEITSQSVDGEIKKMIQMYFAVMVLLILLALVVSFLFSRNLSTPIGLLNAEMKKVTTGDLSRPVKVKSGDEIEELADSFDKMRLGIRDRNELLGSLLKTFRGKFGNIAAILARKDIEDLVSANPRIVDILPKELKAAASTHRKIVLDNIPDSKSKRDK